MEKKIEILTAIILSGLVFKEYEDNFNIGVKELESLVKVFFDNNGFPLSRNPSDLVFFSKYLIFCKEIIKDSQKYVPEFLEDIIEKNLNCIHFIKTPNNQLPLFNGAASLNLNQIQKYIDNFKPDNKKNNIGGLYKIKHKNHFLNSSFLSLLQPSRLHIEMNGFVDRPHKLLCLSLLMLEL